MILAIASSAPDAVTPSQNGSTVYLLDLLNGLLQVDEVTLLTPSPPAGPLTRPDRLAVCLAPPEHSRGFIGRHTRSLIRSGVWPGAWMREAPEVYRVLAACRSGTCDACVVLDEPAGIYLSALPPWLPVIVVRHNLFGHAGAWSGLWGPAQQSGASYAKTYIRLRYYHWLAHRFNVWTTRRADVVVAGTTAQIGVLQRISPGTAALLLPFTGIAPTLKPNRQPSVRVAPRRLVAVFVASYAYPPNAEAVRWFVSEVLPKLTPEVRRDFLFRFIGHSPPPDVVERLAPDAGVEFAGFVDDLESALAEADLGIIPLRSGDGVKVKSVTLLGSGLPTVSTSIGVEGLPPGGCLVADQAAEFAAALTRCREPQLRARLSREAAEVMRRYVESAQPEAVFRRAIELARERCATRRSGIA